MSFYLVFYGEPIPAARPRVTKNGHAFTPERYRTFKSKLSSEVKEIVSFSRQKGSKEFDFPETRLSTARAKWLRENRYELTIVFHCSSRVGDLDNLLKGVQDALEQGGALANDSQIDKVWAKKTIDKDNPRIEIMLKRISDEGNKDEKNNNLTA